MKKLLLYLAFLMPVLAFTGCGKDDDDEPNVPNKPDIETPTDNSKEATLSVSDDVIGFMQSIVYKINYKTENPNILVTWYLDGEKLNKTPFSELEQAIFATKLGKHEIKAVVSDGDKIVECSKEIDVVECDLCRGIIGDSKNKIQRTLKTDSNSDVLTSTASNITEQYYFSNNKLYKIYREQNVPKTPQNKVDYTYPYNMFSSLFSSYSDKFGTPYEECFTNLDSSDDSIIEYGGWIYSGTMQIFAKFKKDDKNAEIEVGPCRSNQVGFNLTEQIEKL